MPGNIPQKIWLFRIVQYENLSFLLENGMYSDTHPGRDPNYIFIGDPALTDQRRDYPVPVPDGGHIGDYVAFYFGQLSPMLLNIKTGWRGIPQRPQREIVYVCCTLEGLEQAGCRYVFTDGHAKDRISQFYQDRTELGQIDWTVVYQRYWRNDENDWDRQRRKQAELLVREHVPPSCVERLVVYDQEMQSHVQGILDNLGLNLDIYINPERKFYY